MRNCIALLILVFLTTTPVIFAQTHKEKEKPLSPPAQAECKFADGKTITVNYSSPRMRGRKIFGDLVPYGEVWRTGANKATAFVTTAGLTVGGVNVPSGSYTLFTVPNQDKWTLIINKKTGEWGIPYKYESDELGHADMRVSKTASPVEEFTIAFDQKGSSCQMNMSWENTEASVEVVETR